MDNTLIYALTVNNTKEVSQLYYANRDAFINFGLKYGLDKTDLIEIYQEAFIAIRNQAINGKLTNVKASFKTYLFGIGKFMIYDLLKEKNKTLSYDSNLHIVSDKIEAVTFEINSDKLTEKQQLLKKYFNQLGKKCQKLLTLFYFNGLSIDEIVETTDYNSNAVVRSQKSRCIKTLKNLIKQQN